MQPRDPMCSTRLSGVATVACFVFALTACDSSKPAADAETTAAPEVASAPPAPASLPRPMAQPSAIPAPADVAQAPADAQKTASGLASKVLTPGAGAERPRPTDTVRVHYTGWSKDGTMFDSSVTRGRPTSFRLNQVIPGWTEGLQLMVSGEKRRLWIPASLAYGDKPARPGAPS
jgi:FKBP-type peptidyl-prolyl cis-trans isomerase